MIENLLQMMDYKNVERYFIVEMMQNINIFQE